MTVDKHFDRRPVPVHHRGWVATLLGYLWTSPLTLVAWLAARVCGCRRVPARGPHEIAFVGGAWARWHRLIGTVAGTCGQVVIYLDDAAHERCAVHEHRHIQQCMVFGPLSPVLYVIGLAIGACRGHAYRLNPMEVDARRAAGQE